MRMPRFSIAKAMAIVGVVALNAAVARALYVYDLETLIGIALTGLALQGAVLGLVSDRRSNRAFCVGFTLLGLAAMGSFIWGRILPRELIAVGELGESPQFVNVSWASAFWLNYGVSVSDLVEPWLANSRILTDPDWIASVMFQSVIWSLPQFFVALVGGFVALVISKLARWRPAFWARSTTQVSAPPRVVTAPAYRENL